MAHSLVAVAVAVAVAEPNAESSARHILPDGHLPVPELFFKTTLYSMYSMRGWTLRLHPTTQYILYFDKMQVANENV